MPRRISRTIALFVFIALSCAVETRAQSVPVSPAPPQNTDLSSLESDAVNWLQGLIRINTTNPPGNELVAAKYLADILDREGIHSETFESTPGRGFLVARLSASAVPDPRERFY